MNAGLESQFAENGSKRVKNENENGSVLDNDILVWVGAF